MLSPNGAIETPHRRTLKAQRSIASACRGGGGGGGRTTAKSSNQKPDGHYLKQTSPFFLEGKLMGAYVLDGIVKALGEATDVERVLEQHQMTPRQLLHAMRSRRGKSQLKARRELSKIHSELVAQRFSPYAVHKLCQLLSEEKPELRLKGALSILTVSGLTGKEDKPRKKDQAAMGESERTPEDGAVLSALVEVLRARREAAAREQEQAALRKPEAANSPPGVPGTHLPQSQTQQSQPDTHRDDHK
jgi:hypothetical protein